MKEILYHIYTARGARITVVPVDILGLYELIYRLDASKNKALHNAIPEALGYFDVPSRKHFFF